MSVFSRRYSELRKLLKIKREKKHFPKDFDITQKYPELQGFVVLVGS